MNPVIIICSRKESSRIPEKCFKRVAGVMALEHILNRVKKAKLHTVIAVPAHQKGIYAAYIKGSHELYGGNPESPLHRMADYLKENPLYTHVIRITHDDILIDVQTIKEMLVVLRTYPQTGYIFSPGIIEGAGVEIISRDNLLWAAKHHPATEFVSYFVRGHGLPMPEIYRHKARESVTRPYRMTMDYIEDWQVLNTALSHTGKYASADVVCKYLDHHPELLTINAQPLITFYTCAHNAEKTISATIASVLSLNENLEYIVIDDASTDNTVSEIAKFSRDKRMRLIVNESNKGLASSSNLALASARGKFIMRVDADDMLLPCAFKAAFWIMAKQLEDGYAVVYPAYYEVGESARESSVHGNVNHHAGCALMLRSVLNEYRFRDGLRHWDGLELYKRLSKKPISYLIDPIWFYRISSKSMSKTKLGTRAKMLITLGLDGIKVRK